jgi:hypothetical protein
MKAGQPCFSQTIDVVLNNFKKLTNLKASVGEVMYRIIISLSRAILSLALSFKFSSTALVLNLFMNSFQEIFPSAFASIFFMSSSISREVSPRFRFRMAFLNSTSEIEPLPS